MLADEPLTVVNGDEVFAHGNARRHRSRILDSGDRAVGPAADRCSGYGRNPDVIEPLGVPALVAAERTESPARTEYDRGYGHR